MLTVSCSSACLCNANLAKHWHCRAVPNQPVFCLPQTAVFDAWAAYDKEAIGVYWPTGDSKSKQSNIADFRRPASEVRLTIHWLKPCLQTLITL